MFKDSGDTLYQHKQLLKKQGEIYTRVLEIGIWNMDTTVTVFVIHGLTKADIRVVDAMIIKDDGDFISWWTRSSAIETTLSAIETRATNVQLSRATDGLFDSVDFDDGAMNRGYITITYKV